MRMRMKKKNNIFLSILTRNQSNYLKHYLKCIDELSYDKKDIFVHIITNNNDDNTESVLTDWINSNINQYSDIVFENKNYENAPFDKEWKPDRLKLMGEIRQKSIDICKKTNCGYYFVADTDNWVESITLEYLISKEKPIIAPFLIDFAERSRYSNYFNIIDEDGYYLPDTDFEIAVWQRQIRETFTVPVVHCTYMVNTDYLNDLTYITTKKTEHEFVTFSNSARKNNIEQWLCPERMFGFVRYDTIVDFEDAHEMMKQSCERRNGN
jgi:hypothetical protein